MAQYFCFSSNDTEYTSINEDSTEKEEKKLEPEFLDHQLVFNQNTVFYFPQMSKVFNPEYTFRLSYFPDILTPPPLTA